MNHTRRDTLLMMLSTLAATALPGAALAKGEAKGLVFGPEKPFAFEELKKLAEAHAREPWVNQRSPQGAVLDLIDYDAFQAISFSKDFALWNDGKGAAPIQLFHMGKYFQEPCQIYVVEDGQAREILYRQDYFNMPPGSPAHKLPDDIGFAGFRIQEPSQKTDWLAFLGASYFRSSGPLNQYGPSARGIAINTATSVPEEFPRFAAFWLERVAGEKDRVITYALLDGVSVTGAYRIDSSRDDKGEVVQDIDLTLYPRKPIDRLGIAPMTSMYWYSETRREKAIDWRPEIHDSDGLAIWTGTGERIWRPLANPDVVTTNAFLDDNIRGFGLLQRDRKFENYQDDGVFYERRPSIWIEPKGSWGKGEVQLVEIPTNVEHDDNIVCYWVPAEKAVPGEAIELGYRLYWVDEEHFPEGLGRVVSSYVGVGGIPGQPRPKGAVRFVIDFRGPEVAELKRGDAKPEIWLSRGSVSLSDSYPVVSRPGLYRAFFDTVVEGSEPLDMRLFIRADDGEALTETWLYQYRGNPATAPT